MSNDNKTLADVKPGGRVRLGDAPWPEIDAILADAYSAGAEGLPFEGIARRAAVRKAVAALSAQPSPPTCKEGLQVHPSPGGQGNAQVTDEMVDAACRAYFDTAEDAVAVDHTCMETALRAALAARQPDTAHAAYHTGKAIGRREAELEAAARQPVRSSTVSDDMMDVVDRLGSEHDEADPRAWDHMLIYAPTEKLAARLAARQPVGEAVELARAKVKISALELQLATYEAPAQAVDLEQFRDAITREYANSRALCDMPRILECERLLALIDSHGARNG